MNAAHRSNVDLVVMAAGMGSRFGGVKQLAKVGPSGELLLDYAIYDARLAGIKTVHFIVRAEILADFQAHVGSRYSEQMDVRYLLQRSDDLPLPMKPDLARSKPWGTGHAIWSLREQVTRPFIAINADDFYGRDAIHQLAQFLANNQSTNHHAMVAYNLANTLSDHGSVSRGICQFDQNSGGPRKLSSVIEHTNIRASAGDIVGEANGAAKTLAAENPVSMNCWGLMPSIFPQLTQLLEEFLRGHEDLSKCEFYLPAAIDTLIARKQCEVSCFQTEESWFGLTFPQDAELVAQRLQTMVANGRYSSPL